MSSIFSSQKSKPVIKEKQQAYCL